MPIAFACPHCGNQMNVADQYAGQTGPCSACGKQITIPKPNSQYAPGVSPAAVGAGVSGLVIVLGVALFGAVVCCGILVALLLPAVQGAREAARRAQSSNNLKQLSIALHNYHDTYRAFPPAVVKDENGKPLYSGRVLLLPFLEQSPLYDAFDKTKAWDDPQNAMATSTRLPVFEDASSTSTTSPRTDYLFITGPGTIFEELPNGKPLTMADVTDGLSGTIFVIETSQAGAHWAEPKDFDITQLTSLPPGNHPVGNLAGFADGSVQTLSKDMDPATFRALLTRNGGEQVHY